MRDFYRTAVLDPLRYTDNPVYINISILPCPLGFTLTKECPCRCECNQLLQSLNGVSCYIQDQTIGRSGLVWVGSLNDDNETVVASEYCSYDYCNKGDSNMVLTLSVTTTIQVLCVEDASLVSVLRWGVHSVCSVPTSTLLSSYYLHWQDLHLCSLHHLQF